VICVVKISFTVRLEKELVEKLDEEAKKRELSRSRLIEHILSEYFQIKIHNDSHIFLEELRSEIEKIKGELEEIKKAVKVSRSESGVKYGISKPLF